jgi:hypothetical protein
MSSVRTDTLIRGSAAAVTATDSEDVRVHRQTAGGAFFAVGAACLCALAWASTAKADNFQFKVAPADQAAAAAAVLKLSDIASGKGWTGGAIKPDRSPDTPDCPNVVVKVSDLVVTGDAESKFKYQGGVGSIHTSSGVFRTTDMLEDYWQRDTGNPAVIACSRKSVEKSVQKYGRLVSFKELALPRIGSHTLAYRAHIRYDKGPSMLFDIIVFTSGRTICSITTSLLYSAGAPSVLLTLDQRVIGILASRISVT